MGIYFNARWNVKNVNAVVDHKNNMQTGREELCDGDDCLLCTNNGTSTGSEDSFWGDDYLNNRDFGFFVDQLAAMANTDKSLQGSFGPLILGFGLVAAYGPDTCRKLAEDFKKHRESFVTNPSNRNFVDVYDGFTKEFERCSKNGMVEMY